MAAAYEGNAARRLDNPVEYRPLNRNIFLQMAAGSPKSRRDVVIDFAVRMDLVLASEKYGWSADHVAGIRRLFLSGTVSWRGVKEACLRNLTPEQLESLATQPEMSVPTFSETLSSSWTSSPSFGGGWGGSTSTPGSGGTAPSAVSMYPDGHKLDNGEGVYLGVQSYHHDDIPDVEFGIEGSDWLAVPRSKHPTRDVYGHWVYVPASAASADGVAEFRWRFTPQNGDQGRVLSGGKLTFNNGGSVSDKTTYYAKSEFTFDITSKSGDFTVDELVYFNESATDKLAATVVSQTASTLTVKDMYPLTSSNHLKDINASMTVTGQTSSETATVDSGYTEPACTSGDPAHTLCQAIGKYGYSSDAAAYATVKLKAGTYYNFRAAFAEGQSQNTNGYLTIEPDTGVSRASVVVKPPAVAMQEGCYANCDWVHFNNVTINSGSGSTKALETSSAATRRIWLESVHFDQMQEEAFSTTMWQGGRWVTDLQVDDMAANILSSAVTGTIVLEPTVDTADSDIFAGTTGVFGGSLSNVDPDAFGPTSNHTDLWQQRDTATDDNVVVYGLECVTNNVCQGFFSRGTNAATAQAFVNNLLVMDDYPQGTQFKNPVSDFVFACNTVLASFFLIGLSDASVTGFWGGADILFTQNVFQWVDITDDQSSRGGHTPATLASGNTNVVWDTNASINYGTTASAVGAVGEDLSGVDANWVEGGVSDRDWATWFNDTGSDDFRAKSGSDIAAETGTPYIVEDRQSVLLAATWAMGSDQYVAAPSVSSLNPNSAARNQTGVDITITGTDFVDGADATFSGTGITVNSTTFVNSTKLTANIDLAADATLSYRDVTVTNPDTQDDTLSSGFRVLGAGGLPDSDAFPAAGSLMMQRVLPRKKKMGK